MNRSKNFLDSERKLLIELMNKHKSKIERKKKTDSKSTKEKSDAWDQSCTKFNSISTHTHRDAKTLQRYWKNLKTRAKADIALARPERLKLEEVLLLH